ncbi:MAG: BMC domain-containing protein [Candidatus Poribacteria bacterium]
MAKMALGLIETMGLVAAIGAADSALKSADVQLIGFDFAGNGGTTVKIEGEVSAVKFAVEAGVSTAEKIYNVLSWHVIPRPDSGMDFIIMANPKKTLFAGGLAIKASTSKNRSKKAKKDDSSE